MDADFIQVNRVRPGLDANLVNRGKIINSTEHRFSPFAYENARSYWYHGGMNTIISGILQMTHETFLAYA